MGEVNYTSYILNILFYKLHAEIEEQQLFIAIFEVKKITLAMS